MIFQTGDIGRLREDFRITNIYHFLYLKDHGNGYYTALCLETGRLHKIEQENHCLEKVA